MIQAVPRHRLEELAAQPEYVAGVHAVAQRLEADLRRPWAQTRIPPEHPVAYFCSEYGVHCSLPLYGGGLGVLAGDTLQAASDLAVPMVGIGLLYREGYLHQRVDQTGWQQEYWTATDFERLPAVLVTGPDREPLTVAVIIRRRTVRIQIWRINVGRVPLYLLDTDRDDNHPIDRWITARLYVGDRHTRLAQYLVLGVGGIRALPPWALSRRSSTSTQEEMKPELGDFADQSGIPRATSYGLGRATPANEQAPVSMTPLALRTSRAANGVSRCHGAVARAMWHPLWPDRVVEDVPIGHVTTIDMGRGCLGVGWTQLSTVDR